MPEKEKPVVTIGETADLITNTRRGKYTYDSQARQELVRALKFASKVWGDTTPWTEIDESSYLQLLRDRLDELLDKDAHGVRATEITVAWVIRSAKWLRDIGRIDPDVALPPARKVWKAAIKDHWKGKKREARDPEPQQLQHTVEDARAILKASTFDPRFELLMWLGMDLTLGQVARARRSDLELPFGGHSFGTLTVHSPVKDRDGKPRSQRVDLDAGQRMVIDRMLGVGGYLYAFEKQYPSGSDYLLFPAGYMAGRVGRRRGKNPAFVLSPKASLTKPASGSWIRKSFTLAEALAKVPHVSGRGAFGLRRGSESHPSVRSAQRQALRGELAASATPAMIAADIPPDFTPLAADAVMAAMLHRRWIECVRCVRAKADLAAIVMMGSLLEALLVARGNCLTDRSPMFNAKSTPMDSQTRKPLELSRWTLGPYIDVAEELKWIRTSAKEVAVVLRDYRNYVHPQKEWKDAITLNDEDSMFFWELTKTLARQLLKSAAAAS